MILLSLELQTSFMRKFGKFWLFLLIVAVILGSDGFWVGLVDAACRKESKPPTPPEVSAEREQNLALSKFQAFLEFIWIFRLSNWKFSSSPTIRPTFYSVEVLIEIGTSTFSEKNKSASSRNTWNLAKNHLRHKMFSHNHPILAVSGEITHLSCN